MANFNANQYRDSRGRFAKRPDGLLKRAFHTFRGFTERRTCKAGQEQGAGAKTRQKAPELAELDRKRSAELDELRAKCKGTAPARSFQTCPENARRRYVAAIKAEIKRIADWIEPEETGAFPHTVIKHLRRLLSQYEAVLPPDTRTRQQSQPETVTAILASPRVTISGTAPELLAALLRLDKADKA
jgi:hypothetical protein